MDLYTRALVTHERANSVSFAFLQRRRNERSPMPLFGKGKGGYIPLLHESEGVRDGDDSGWRKVTETVGPLRTHVTRETLHRDQVSQPKRLPKGKTRGDGKAFRWAAP
ncbi:hypothetical protein BHM03_00005625 [Ensete ventricosum]|nr:hypothetical protein BHM03_00005625 [Ensete ventricosum]